MYVLKGENQKEEFYLCIWKIFYMSGRVHANKS